MKDPQTPNDEEDWTPLRFSLQAMLKLMAALALFFALVKGLDNNIFPALTFVLSVVLVCLFVRLVRLGTMRKD